MRVIGLVVGRGSWLPCTELNPIFSVIAFPTHGPKSRECLGYTFVLGSPAAGDGFAAVKR
jgi:hypothetical protein